MRTLPLRITGGGGGGDARLVYLAGVLFLLAVCLGQVMVHTGGDETSEEFVEGLVVVHPDGAFTGEVVFVDVDVGEEGLVEQAPGGLVGFEIGGVAVSSEVEGVGEASSGGLELVIGAGELVLDRG